jgi:uncharacterized protein
MISERELRRIAGRVGLGVGETEHEYVVVCALDALSQTPLLGLTFCLKGGTALRQLYFQDWRHSVDLDFSVLPTFSRDLLRSGLEEWLALIGQLHGLQVTITDFHPANGMTRVRARCLGPLRHARPLLLDITLDEPVLLDPPRLSVITGPFSAPNPRVLSYALEEIMAEKLRSILQRGKARDYYDVWRLLGEKAAAFDHQVAVEVFRRKCAHKGLPAVGSDAFFAPETLAEAEPYWAEDLADQIIEGPLPAWHTVIADLRGLLPSFLDQSGT